MERNNRFAANVISEIKSHPAGGAFFMANVFPASSYFFS
jgi:hypothetical protein